jgi:tRNA (guanine-N7-)-methyltransferase
MSHTPVSENIRRFVVPWLETPWPLSPGELFGRSAPLAVEIGFGNGEFLQEAAAERPDWNFIGVEKSWSCVKRLIRRLDEADLGNVLVLEGEAGFLLRNAIPPRSVDRLFIHHPDPWPRPAHRSRRLIQSRFLDIVAERLSEGGVVTITTDHAELAEWIDGQLEDRSYLLIPDEPVEDFAEGVVTRWAAKAVEEGTPVRRFDRVAADGPVEPVERQEVETVANVILKGPPGRNELFRDFEERSFRHHNQGVEVVVRFSRLFRQTDESSWLIETMVMEGGLVQHLGISVILRDDGEVLLKPHALGHPRPTWGVKAALRHAAWLVLKSNPEMKVAKSTVGPLERK